MAFDAFDGGIEPGGLRSKSDIKLLICYLLKSVARPLTKVNILEIMQEYGLANYFEVIQALNELLEAGSVTCREEETDCEYTVTKSGRISADMLESSLPLSVREKAVQAAIKLTAKIKREQENHAVIEKGDSGYYTHCTILDNGTELLSVRLFAGDILQAESIKELFLANPAKFYRRLLGFFTTDSQDD